MKNLLNVGFVALILVILGCSCPKINELIKQGQTESPSPTPFSSNTSATPAGSPSNTSSKSPGGAELTMETYNQITTNMSRTDVGKLLGGKGEEVSSQTGGGQTFTVVKWEGSNFKTIIITFQNDKVMSKSQYGLN